MRSEQAAQSTNGSTSWHHAQDQAAIAHGRASQFSPRAIRAGANPHFTGQVSLFDPRAAGFQDPILVNASGGIGSKLKVAMAMGLHEAAGMDVVTTVANSLLAHGSEPLAFHYVHSSAVADPATSDRLLAGIAEGCRLSGVAMSGGYSIEQPGQFEDGDYDLAGFCSGMVERPALLPRFDIAEGDGLLGLASSGPHAHGFAAIRRIVTHADIGYREPAPFAAGISLGQALLQPTRSYAPIIRALLRDTNAVKGIIPVGEGGLTTSLARATPPALSARVELSSWRLPLMFQWFQSAGDMPIGDLLQTFNCGLGLVLIVDKLRMISVLKVLRDLGEKPLAIGNLTARQNGEAVRYSGLLQG